MNYTQKMIQAFIEGLIAEKVYRGWEMRSNGLLEDCTGNKCTIDIEVSDDIVLVKLKAVEVL